MAENKTQATNKSVKAFLKKVTPETKQVDCNTVLEIMNKISGEDPKMWGENMVGFGNFHYKYASGHEGNYFLTGFSPRKQNLTVYILAGFDKFPDLMEKLGKFKNSKSCLYIKTLDDIHLPTLKKLIKASIAKMKIDYK